MDDLVNAPVAVWVTELVGVPVPLEVCVNVAGFDGVGNGVLDALPVGVKLNKEAVELGDRVLVA